MRKPKLSTVKTVTKIVVGRSVAFCVATTIASVVPVENKTQKVELYIGANVLAMMVAKSAADFTDFKIDEWIETYRKVKADLNKPKETDLTIVEAP